MPNWCITDFTFEGKKEEIIKFHKRLNKIIEKESTVDNDFGKGWLGDIVIDFGYHYNDVRCKGEIQDGFIGEVVVNGDIAFFSFSTETAWAPMFEMWDLILPKEYPSIRYVYLATEPGQRLYINTDTERKYYNVEYLLELFLPSNVLGKVVDEYEFCANRDEVLEKVYKIVGKRLDTIDEALSYLEDLAEESGEELDSYIKIVKFEPGFD